ncbi:MAG: Rne/Rng family ribonuclease [Planctomycetota bacterium]|nr:Rne/Rng family ribonuclease [Planctomycetota bacterium]
MADPDECRIALLQNGRLDELYIERATSTSNVGNIYKGRVTNVEASIQAAFVDFGRASHGFLHISDLHPKYFPHGKGETEQVGRKTPRRQRPPIQNCLRRGDTVIVQIIKEGIGTKGPTLTSYISLPGRFLVMMPGMDQLGVSRKIEDEDQRRKARELLGQLELPSDMGFIVRTAGVDRTKRDLQRDLSYLVRLWKKVATREKTEQAPAELYKESDLVIRTIRDVFDSSVSEILVDDATVAAKVQEFLSVASPRSRNIVKHYDGTEPIYYKHGIEAEIDSLHSRHVPLPCGGSLVIEQTEALVAIDVNSGRFRVPDNAEETAYRVDLEAVEEIARQLRLRDLGGLIICDMIDLGQERHIREIENRFRDALKKHKERAKVLRMSKFGIIELTRQRQRPSLAKSNFRECPRCFGTGRVKAIESVALDVMRRVRLAAHRGGVARIDAEVAVDVANEIQNRKRRQMAELEQSAGLRIQVVGRTGVGVEHVRVSCTDRRGREVAAATHGEAAATETVLADADSKGVTNGKASPRRSKRGRRSRKNTGTATNVSQTK